MGIWQEIHFESGRLNVDATGEFSLKEAKRAFLDIVGAAIRYQATKVLIDARKLQGRPKDIERFIYGEFAAKATFRIVREHGISPRFAYIMKEPLRDPRRFGENVAVNRGMTVKVFETPEEAFTWLESTPANEPDAGNPV